MKIPTDIMAVGIDPAKEVHQGVALAYPEIELLNSRFEKIFDNFVIQCQEKGLLKERPKIIDATHIIADVAIPNTVNLLRKGRRRILKAIKKERRTLEEPLKKYLPEEELCRKPTKEELAREFTLSKDLIKEIKEKYSSKIERTIGLLEKAVEPEKKRKLVSFTDPGCSNPLRISGR